MVAVVIAAIISAIVITAVIIATVMTVVVTAVVPAITVIPVVVVKILIIFTVHDALIHEYLTKAVHYNIYMVIGAYPHFVIIQCLTGSAQVAFISAIAVAIAIVIHYANSMVTGGKIADGNQPVVAAITLAIYLY